MGNLGHGHWLAMERHIADRTETPLTIEKIQSTIAEAGGQAPVTRSISAQLANDQSPKGKTREAYELFWANYKSAIPLSDLTRLSDIDDCEMHLKLRDEISQKAVFHRRHAACSHRTGVWLHQVASSEEAAVSVDAPAVEPMKQEPLHAG
jgi:hypothetical protein